MRIYISDLSFSYDLHSLTKAFFQSEDVEVKEWGSEISNIVEAFYYRVETPDGEVREVRVENCGEDRPQFKNKIKRERQHPGQRQGGKSVFHGKCSFLRS